MRSLWKFRLLGAVLTALLLWTACGDNAADDDDSSDDDLPGDDDALDDDGDDDSSAACRSGVSFHFDLTPGRRDIPYPSTLLTDEDATSPTGLRVNLAGETTLFLSSILEKAHIVRDGLSTLSGFGLSTPIWLPVDAEPDAAMLPTGADPSPDDAVLCAALDGSPIAVQASYLPERKLLRLAPTFPLHENTTYACLALARLRTTDSMCYERPASLVAVLDDSVAADGETLAAQQRLAPQFAELLAHLDLSPDDVVGATIFHTQTITPELLSMGEQLRARADDDPPHAGDWQKVEGQSLAIDAMWETTYDTVDWLNDGLLTYDAQGAPQTNGTSAVTLRLTLPASGTPPYPVVIYAHGLAQDRRFGEPVARDLAAAGIATIAIDWAHHGARMETPLGLSAFDQMRTYLPTPLTDARRVRDAYRQGIGDMMWLLYLLHELADLDLAPAASGGDGLADLDVTRIAYAGMSLGSIHGAILAAVEPRVDTYLLNVGAANWRSMVFEGENDDVIGRMLRQTLDDAARRLNFEYPGDWRLYYDLYLSIVDGADSYSFAPAVLARGSSLNILQQMAAHDHIIGEPGGGELARALGLTLLEPIYCPIDGLPIAVAPFTGPAVYQYDTYRHNHLLETNAVARAARRQAVSFFASAFADGVATIIDPF